MYLQVVHCARLARSPRMGNAQKHMHTLYSIKKKTKQNERMNEWTTERQQQQQPNAENGLFYVRVMCVCLIFVSICCCVFPISYRFYIKFHSFNWRVNVMKKRTNALGQTKHEIQIYCCCAVHCVLFLRSSLLPYCTFIALIPACIFSYIVHNTHTVNIYCQCFIFAHFVIANEKLALYHWRQTECVAMDRKREREKKTEERRWIIFSVSIISYYAQYQINNWIGWTNVNIELRLEALLFIGWVVLYGHCVEHTPLRLDV